MLVLVMRNQGTEQDSIRRREKSCNVERTGRNFVGKRMRIRQRIEEQVKRGV